MTHAARPVSSRGELAHVIENDRPTTLKTVSGRHDAGVAEDAHAGGAVLVMFGVGTLRWRRHDR
jgi:hypothetical protein